MLISSLFSSYDCWFLPFVIFSSPCFWADTLHVFFQLSLLFPRDNKIRAYFSSFFFIYFYFFCFVRLSFIYVRKLSSILSSVYGILSVFESSYGHHPVRLMAIAFVPVITARLLCNGQNCFGFLARICRTKWWWMKRKTDREKRERRGRHRERKREGVAINFSGERDKRKGGKQVLTERARKTKRWRGKGECAMMRKRDVYKALRERIEKWHCKGIDQKIKSKTFRIFWIDVWKSL